MLFNNDYGIIATFIMNCQYICKLAIGHLTLLKISRFMQLSVIGLNHHTAPVGIRERLAFAAVDLPDALTSLMQSGLVSEAVILSTCNRTEIYSISHPEAVIQWWANYHQIDVVDIQSHLYTFVEKLAVRHAFRVACGLDSMVLGEPQILGQLKDAVRIAQQCHTLQKNLHTLFQKTFAIAKDIRTHTAVGENSVSMAAASVKMVEQIFPSISELNVLFIGAGEMIALVATYFDAKSPKNIHVLNRSLGRAEELCQTLKSPSNIGLLTELPEVLHQYDVIVSSTASPFPIVGKGLVERALKQRRGMPIFMLDLAVPRDIESEVAQLNDAYLYTVDDMVDIVQSGRESRIQAAEKAEQLVNIRVEEFINWRESREVVPLICALRDEGERARVYVLDNAMKQLAKGVPPEEVLARLSVQLTNKLLHAPTRTLNKESKDHPDLAHAISQIYQLKNNKKIDSP